MASSSPRWVKVLGGLVGLIVGASLIYSGVREFMGLDRLGSAYKVSDKETVRYVGKATEEDAKRVAELLREAGFFTGTNTKDVFVRRADNEIPSVSIVVSGNWNTPEALEGLKSIGEAVAEKLNAHPMKARFVDGKLNVLKEISIP